MNLKELESAIRRLAVEEDTLSIANRIERLKMYIDAYVASEGLSADKITPLFKALFNAESFNNTDYLPIPRFHYSLLQVIEGQVVENTKFKIQSILTNPIIFAALQIFADKLGLASKMHWAAPESYPALVSPTVIPISTGGAGAIIATSIIDEAIASKRKVAEEAQRAHEVVKAFNDIKEAERQINKTAEKQLQVYNLAISAEHHRFIMGAAAEMPTAIELEDEHKKQATLLDAELAAHLTAIRERTEKAKEALAATNAARSHVHSAIAGLVGIRNDAVGILVDDRTRAPTAGLNTNIGFVASPDLEAPSHD